MMNKEIELPVPTSEFAKAIDNLQTDFVRYCIDFAKPGSDMQADMRAILAVYGIPDQVLEIPEGATKPLYNLDIRPERVNGSGGLAAYLRANPPMQVLVDSEMFRRCVVGRGDWFERNYMQRLYQEQEQPETIDADFEILSPKQISAICPLLETVTLPAQ